MFIKKVFDQIMNNVGEKYTNKKKIVYERDIWLIFVYNNPFMILMISEFKKESKEYKLYQILSFSKNIELFILINIFNSNIYNGIVTLTFYP